MANKIIIKRGGGGNVDSISGSILHGEPVVATGSFTNLAGPLLLVGKVITTAGVDTGSLHVAGRMQDGATTPTLATDVFDGQPFYNSTDKKLYILKKAGNTEITFNSSSISNVVYTNLGDATTQVIEGSLRLTENIIAENFIVSSSVTFVTTSFSSGSTKFGDTSNDTHIFTGSVDITGSFKVSNGAATFNDNVTLGSAATDTITFNADVASNILPDGDNTRTLGDASNRWTLYGGAGSVITGSLSGSFAGALSQATASSFRVTDLTVNRVVYVSTGGELFDSAKLTYQDSDASMTVTASYSVTASYLDGGTF